MAKEQDSNIKSTAEVVAGILKAVPVYEDALQSGAKQVGKALETILKTVNIALMPMRTLVWGYERIEGWITQRVSQKMKNVALGNIVTPPPTIAGPVIEALRYVGHDDMLRELYANLLASAMDKATMTQAHPAYVEILKNLCSDEALVLTAYIAESAHPAINIKGVTNDGSYILYQRFFTHLDKVVALNNPQLIPAYLDNLIRLGILETPTGAELFNQELYEPLETDRAIEPYLVQIVDSEKEVRFERLVIRLTMFGAQFVQRVVVEKT